MSKKISLFVGLFMALVLGLSACAPATTAPAPYRCASHRCACHCGTRHSCTCDCCSDRGPHGQAGGGCQG